MLHLKKRRLSGLLAVLFLFLITPEWSVASSHRTSYQTALGQDLDGDHIPETATIRQSSDVYKVSIHFTSGRPRLHLTVYPGQADAGLSFQTVDVDGDRNKDLVVTSATALRPIAVWLNHGEARFRRVSSWIYGGLDNSPGPAFHRQNTYQPDTDVNISADPLAHAVKMIHAFDVEQDVEQVAASHPEQLPSDCILHQVSERGPPSDSAF